MTKKNYERAVNLLNYSHFSTMDKAIIADFLCNYFADDNPRFNRERFLKVLGLDEEVLNAFKANCK